MLLLCIVPPASPVLLCERAADLMRKLIESPTFPEFLTVPAYAEVLKAAHYDPNAFVFGQQHSLPHR